MTHLPAGQRTIDPGILAQLRELALDELGELLAGLDAGNLEFVDFTHVGAEDESGKSTGVSTYTVIVRRVGPPRPWPPK